MLFLNLSRFRITRFANSHVLPRCIQQCASIYGEISVQLVEIMGEECSYLPWSSVVGAQLLPDWPNIYDKIKIKNNLDQERHQDQEQDQEQVKNKNKNNILE